MCRKIWCDRYCSTFWVHFLWTKQALNSALTRVPLFSAFTVVCARVFVWLYADNHLTMLMIACPAALTAPFWWAAGRASRNQLWRRMDRFSSARAHPAARVHILSCSIREQRRLENLLFFLTCIKYSGQTRKPNCLLGYTITVLCWIAAGKHRAPQSRMGRKKFRVEWGCYIFQY
jgi:hypothetical protein